MTTCEVTLGPQDSWKHGGDVSELQSDLGSNPGLFVPGRVSVLWSSLRGVTAAAAECPGQSSSHVGQSASSQPEFYSADAPTTSTATAKPALCRVIKSLQYSILELLVHGYEQQQHIEEFL